MNQNIDLKAIEKKSYQIIFQDGIYDIMFGILLISFAVTPTLREIIGLGYIFFMIVPAPLFYILAKKYISTQTTVADLKGKMVMPKKITIGTVGA